MRKTIPAMFRRTAALTTHTQHTDELAKALSEGSKFNASGVLVTASEANAARCPLTDVVLLAGANPNGPKETLYVDRRCFSATFFNVVDTSCYQDSTGKSQQHNDERYFGMEIGR